LKKERERMQNLKVHDKLSKAQRLMKGRRFRVLKEIDEEIEQEVNLLFYFLSQKSCSSSS
jgi:hypothetical protein